MIFFCISIDSYIIRNIFFTVKNNILNAITKYINMKQYWALIVWVILYLLFKYFIPYGTYISYPINIFVTFLHEFWHIVGAFITGWDVISVEINSDGSGMAVTSGWWRSIILMGWYIGSAILWNILLYIGFKQAKYAKIVMYTLAGIMIITGVFLFHSILSSLLLFILAGFLIFMTKKWKYSAQILQFLWIVSLLYIIEDFNGWPTSDLSKFSEIFIIIPQFIWMYIWLIIVIIITGMNIKYMFFQR